MSVTSEVTRELIEKQIRRLNEIENDRPNQSAEEITAKLSALLAETARISAFPITPTEAAQSLTAVFVIVAVTIISSWAWITEPSFFFFSLSRLEPYWASSGA